MGVQQTPVPGAAPATGAANARGAYPEPMIDGWHWVAASVVAVLLLILVLLWYDTLRDRPGWSTARATKNAAIGALVIPVGFAAALLLPLWMGGVLIVIPLVIIGVMALAD